VWIDHVDVYDGEDGNLDVINGANYVTISWTRFHYTSASTEHQFSNLIGNSDSKTSDEGKLKTTLHHNWWDDGVKERMPRVRFGQVHVANNLFSTNSSSTCVRAGKSADLRVENNVFIGVNNPIDLYDGDYKAVYSAGNYTENIKKGSASSGTNKNAFTPSYSMGLTDVSTQAKAYALRDSIKLYAGATLPDPGASQEPPPSSSSVQSSSSVVSSSSEMSSSSVASSSSAASSSSQGQVISGTATLTKHGTGSSNQEVPAGSAIVEFYFTISGATGATVAGLPQGVTGTLKGLDYYISGTVASTAAPGAYKFTVTTTGASKNVSKSGTITVTGNGNTEPKSSSSVASSSSEAKSSSSEKLSSSSEVAEPSSSSEISSSSETAQGIQAVVLTRVNLSVSGNELSIMGAMAKPITVFDMQGRLIYRNFSTSNQHAVTLPGAGGYLVRVGSESHTVRIR
jgi:pectate lyase